MTQNLAEQLDLTIYSSPFVSWWGHPLVILGLALLLALVVVSLWFVIKRHFRKKVVIPFWLVVLELLKKGQSALINGKIDSSQAIVLLMTLLKTYTAWLVKNGAVDGMTDKQWLVFIKTIKNFEPYYDDCAIMVDMADQVKFNYMQLQKNQMVSLFEKAIQIVDSTKMYDNN